MIISVILLIAGFAFLVVGANGLVNGASSIAHRFNVPDYIIGLTIVAFGTSSPELVVNLVAAVEENTDIAITNVLGSNIMNVFIILGITALVYPITVGAVPKITEIADSKIKWVRLHVNATLQSQMFDILMAALAGIVVLLMVLIESNRLGVIDGIVLLSFFAIYLIYKLRHSGTSDELDSNAKQLSLPLSVVYVLGGLALLVVGGQWIVDGAVAIARALNVSDAVIGVTIVALGTSLPELATSVIAATKKNSGIALGNVVGSNIFNVFMILGLSSTIHELPPYSGIYADAIMTALAGLLVWLFAVTNKNHEIKRWHGAVLLLIYAAYFVIRIMMWPEFLALCHQVFPNI